MSIHSASFWGVVVMKARLGFLILKEFKKNLRNRSVALVFATDWLHTFRQDNETRYFPSHSRPDKAGDRRADRVAGNDAQCDRRAF
jgi:hypothetical protein